MKRLPYITYVKPNCLKMLIPCSYKVIVAPKIDSVFLKSVKSYSILQNAQPIDIF